MVEMSTVYGHEILNRIAEFVQSHQSWSIFVGQRELDAQSAARQVDGFKALNRVQSAALN